MTITREELDAIKARTKARRDGAVVQNIEQLAFGALLDISTLLAALEAAEAREAQRDSQLRHIAAVAHSGGSAGLTEGEAIIAIRRLTVRAWDRSQGIEGQRSLVLAALAETAP